MALHLDISQGVRIDNLASLQDRVQLRGGRLVVYAEVLSAIVMSIRSYKVRWTPSPEAKRLAGLGSSILSSILGWWAVFGPFHTLYALVWNFKGGVDVTDALLRAHPASTSPLSHPAAAKLFEYHVSVRRTTMWLFWGIVFLLAALFSYLVWTARAR